MTISHPNIEQFNEVVLRLFARLYEAFPLPLNIDRLESVNIGASAIPADATEEETLDIITMTSNVIDWLREEGYLRYEPDPNNAGGYWKVRLTQKGLTVLGYIPTALQSPEAKEPLIQKVRQAIASTASTTGKATANLVVAKIFELGVALWKG